MELRVVFCVEQSHELDTRFHHVRYLASRGSLSDRNREPSEKTINVCLLLLLYIAEAAPQARTGKSELPRTAWVVPGVLMRSSAGLSASLACIAV